MRLFRARGGRARILAASNSDAPPTEQLPGEGRASWQDFWDLCHVCHLERKRILRSRSAENTITVHRFEASLFPVNAYLVETATSIVVVDATLGVSDGKALRSRIEALNKPLAAVIVTHAHPDHYG